MGNVATKAAVVVQRVAKRVKDTIRKAARKAAEVVVDTYYRAKDTAVGAAAKILTEVVRFSVNHPKAFKYIVWTVIGISLTAILASICMAIVLPCIGFTSGGVAAGSLAAAWQASIGNVAAGSLFAILTSAGMGGYGVALVMGGSVAIGAASTIAMAVLSRLIGSGRGGPGFGSGLGIGPGDGPGGPAGIEPGPEPGFVTEIEDDGDQDDNGDDKNHNHDRDYDLFGSDSGRTDDSKDGKEDDTDDFELCNGQADNNGSWKQT